MQEDCVPLCGFYRSHFQEIFIIILVQRDLCGDIVVNNLKVYLKEFIPFYSFITINNSFFSTIILFK